MHIASSHMHVRHVMAAIHGPHVQRGTAEVEYPGFGSEGKKGMAYKRPRME